MTFSRGRKLSIWYGAAVTMITVPIIGHVVLLPMLLRVSGRDTWISGMLAIPAGLLVVLVIVGIKQRYPKFNDRSSTDVVTYQGVGRFISLLLVGYLLFVAVVSTAALLDMVHIAFMPETPLWALDGWFFLAFLYGANRGIKTLMLTSSVLVIIALITGHTITLVASPMKDWANLRPMLEYGWSPVFRGTILISSIWAEFSALLFLPLEHSQAKKMFLVWSVGVFLNILMVLSTATGVVAIFGFNAALNFTFPALQTVRLMSLGFIDRFDIYGMILMLFGCYIRASLYLTIASDSLSAHTQKKGLRLGSLFVLACALFIAALYAATDYWRFVRFAEWYVYAGLGAAALLVVFYVTSFLWPRAAPAHGRG